MSSLRSRLALVFAVTAALVAACIGVLVWELSSRDRLDRAREAAAGDAREAAAIYADGRVLWLGAVRDGPDVPSPLRTAVGDGHVATLVAHRDGEPFVWAGSPAPGAPGGLYVSRSYAADEQALRTLRRTLVEAGAGSTLAVALLGLLVAGRLSTRLRRAAAAAERVAGGDLDARIAAGGRDEVAALGGAVDRMADALRERIARERRFSADVAHELRTPITGLVAAASLLGEERPAALVRERAERLRTLVEDLLEIARLEGGAETLETDAVDLRALCLALADRYPDVVVEDGPPRVLRSDRRRLERVLANLVENALRHGRPPVRVAVGPPLTVRDHGDGFSAAMLAHGTERFASGDAARGGGTGLGLAIAAGQARVLGGRLVLGNAPGGGAVVTVLLPEAAGGASGPPYARERGRPAAADHPPRGAGGDRLHG